MTVDVKKLAVLLASIDEWLGNEDGLMIEDVIEWREQLAAAMGLPDRSTMLNEPPAVAAVDPVGESDHERSTRV